jgi:hypothetical protein
MTFLKKLAPVAVAAAVLVPVAGASPSAGMTARGLKAYGDTLAAEAAAYRGAGMTPAGLRAYGKTLQAEAAAYTAAAAAPSLSQPAGFSWADAALGAALAVAVLALCSVLATGRVRRGLIAAFK